MEKTNKLKKSLVCITLPLALMGNLQSQDSIKISHQDSLINQNKKNLIEMNGKLPYYIEAQGYERSLQFQLSPTYQIDLKNNFSLGPYIRIGMPLSKTKNERVNKKEKKYEYELVEDYGLYSFGIRSEKEKRKHKFSLDLGLVSQWKTIIDFKGIGFDENQREKKLLPYLRTGYEYKTTELFNTFIDLEIRKNKNKYTPFLKTGLNFSYE